MNNEININKNGFLNVVINGFEGYLRDNGFKEYSDAGNLSTVYDYPNRIQKILEEEDFFVDLIDIARDYIELYSKKELKKDSEKNGISAIKKFKEFLES
jgi:hypothetical protein